MKRGSDSLLIVVEEEKLRGRIHPCVYSLEGGAMPVIIRVPCGSNRWSLFAFGFLADNNTRRFLFPLCCQRSGRLFLIAFSQSLADLQTGVSIRIPTHTTIGAEYQRSARCVAF